jgi:hypothetical protein
MSSKSIQDYLPSTKERTFVQGQIPTDLFNQVKRVMKEMGYSWPDVLKASLKRFLDEVPKKK